MPRARSSSDESLPAAPAANEHVSRGFDDSDEFARAIFEALAEGVLVVDHRGRIVAMNSSAERLLGYSTRTLIGVDVRDSPWTLEDENGRSLDIQDWPIIATLESGTPSGRLVVTLRPDGHRRIIVMIAMPLPRPMRGVGRSSALRMSRGNDVRSWPSRRPRDDFVSSWNRRRMP